jgi:hypothetical protein
MTKFEQIESARKKRDPEWDRIAKIAVPQKGYAVFRLNSETGFADQVSEAIRSDIEAEHNAESMNRKRSADEKAEGYTYESRKVG